MRQPIAVEARFDAQGEIRPVAFDWGEQRHVIQDHGRRWEQDGERRFLVRVAGRGAFELAFEPEQGRWSLVRTPEDFGPKRGRRS